MGGLSLGLRQARFRIAAAVDLSPLAVATFRMNFSGVPVIEQDIRTLTGPDILATARLGKGELDLLAGCPPCQGFSSLRTRNRSSAVADERNDLVLEFLRLVRSIRPRLVMVENVPGLATDGRFQAFVSGLRQSGYSADWGVLDAADFGVPQRRRRLVLVASRVGEVSLASASGPRATVRDALDQLADVGASGDPLHDHGEHRSERIRDLIKLIPSDGGSRSDLGPELQLDCHRRCDGYHDVYGRMSWDAQSPTITSGCVNPSKGRFLHPAEHRTITLREALVLQGFPQQYKMSLARGKLAAAELVGNAIPPRFVAAQAAALRPQVMTVPGATA